MSTRSFGNSDQVIDLLSVDGLVQFQQNFLYLSAARDNQRMHRATDCPLVGLTMPDIAIPTEEVADERRLRDASPALGSPASDTRVGSTDRVCRYRRSDPISSRFTPADRLRGREMALPCHGTSESHMQVSAYDASIRGSNARLANGQRACPYILAYTV
jgi:hypothetical protein